MHLNDALGKHPQLTYISCHHEQTCAMAADSYFRMSGRLAAVNVTCGPGGTNAITGVFGAWTDSMGMIVLSGQVKRETLMSSYDLPLRQFGDQEIDIVTMVKGITKYAVLVRDPQTIKFHLEKALYLAKSGRPGPVWLDIPIDVQSAWIEPESLPGFQPELPSDKKNNSYLLERAEFVLKKLDQAERPVILVGAGVRISNSVNELIQFAEKVQVPIVTAWNAHDVIWNDHPLYAGRPGSVGDRSGNFTVQNSDLVLILGSRLNIRQVSYNWQSFARHAYRVMVDIDEAEMQKPYLKIDYPIHSDLKVFLRTLNQCTEGAEKKNATDRSIWIRWCRERLKKYPVILPEYFESSAVNPYVFVGALFEQLEENEKIVTGDGTACVTTFQAAHLKKGQRLYTNSGCASMGFDIPAVIGAHFASPGKRLICLAGDGSIQMNLQDLQTIATHRIPAKIFVLNNRGYHSIRQTQQNFFKETPVGCGEESGLQFPSFKKLAAVWDFPYFQIERTSQLTDVIEKALATPGPIICEVMLDLGQQFAPKLSSRKLEDGSMVTAPLEDMAPFLSREELKENLFYED